MKIFEDSPKKLAKFLADKILSMDEENMYKELKRCGFLKEEESEIKMNIFEKDLDEIFDVLDELEKNKDAEEILKELTDCGFLKEEERDMSYFDEEVGTVEYRINRSTDEGHAYYYPIMVFDDLITAKAAFYSNKLVGAYELEKAIVVKDDQMIETIDWKLNQ